MASERRSFKMSVKAGIEPEASHDASSDPRSQLLAGLAVSDRRLALAGISTAVLEAGEGPPVVLLHEPGSFAAHWLQVLPEIARSHRVIAPDLPGHGASDIGDAELGGDRVLAWLAELIKRTCESPPALLGHLGSGPIAARLAIAQAPPLRSLVLVDSFGLGRFRPAPRFALALFRYVARPNPRTFAGLMNRCTADFAGVRAGLGGRWEPFESYTLDRARSAEGKAALRVMMRELAVPAMRPGELERIAVPIALIWGRHDPVNRVAVAEAASERYGWPLEVIEEAGDDPPLERPQAFLRALRPALARSVDSVDADGLYDGGENHVYSEPIEEREE
jgi:pimeloyl-ACP methyl ester carboxylesterase